MFYQKIPALFSGRSHFFSQLSLAITSFLLCLTTGSTLVSAQTYKHELDTGDKVSLTVKNRNGRVTVIAADEQQRKVTIEAESAGLPVDESDISTGGKGGGLNIEVRQRAEKDRIDVTIRIPSRSKVSIE